MLNPLIKKFTLLILLTITMLLWSSAFVGIRYALDAYHPGSLACLRYIVASLCMAVVWHQIPDKKPIPLKDIPLLALIGLIGITAYNISLNYGEIAVTAAEASFIVSQAPVLNAVLAVLFLKEASKPQLWIGLFISIAGVSLIAYSDLNHFTFGYASLCIIIATVCSTLYTFLQKPLVDRLNALQCICYIIWFGTLGLLIYSPEVWHDYQTAPLASTLSVIYLGIFPGAVAYTLWSFVLARLSTTRISASLYASPLLTALIGWLAINEKPSALVLLGGVTALFGAYIVNKRPREIKAN